MISTFTVVIDANVFFGSRLRSLVLFLAQTNMFRARWTEKINDEWTRNIAEKHGIDIAKLANTRRLVNASVLDCLVSGYEPLEKALTLPDMDDRHVLAAAICVNADLILTFNLKDFPNNNLEPFGIEARHPDEFLQDLFGISSDLFIEAVRQDFKHYIAPKLAFDTYISDLRKAGLPVTAGLIQSLKVLITDQTLE
jgi:predicted nucleic acid-binding protein